MTNYRKAIIASYNDFKTTTMKKKKKKTTKKEEEEEENKNLRRKYKLNLMAPSEESSSKEPVPKSKQIFLILILHS